MSVRSLAKSMVFGVCLLGIPAVASATVMSYTAPSGLDQLNERTAYAWELGGLSVPAGQSVTSATITFTDMYNFAGGANELFVHLLDSALAPGASANGGTVQGLVNCTGGNANNCVADYADSYSGITDSLNPSDVNHSTSPGWFVPSGVANTYLTGQSFDNLGVNPATGSDPGPTGAVTASCTGFTGSGWCYTYAGTSGGNAMYDYTYTFSAAQLTALQQDITNGGNIAIGLDSNCQYFNDGIGLTITTGSLQTQSVVPEPTSLLFVGTGLVLAFRRFRRR